MKTNLHNSNKKSSMYGVTLIELTLVIAVLFVIIGASVFAISGYRDWQLGSEASQQLRMVYNAQRTYLSENPTQPVNTITDAQIIPYLSDNSDALPIIEDLDGNSLPIRVNVTPPVIDDGSADGYDPTGPNDGLWDVGG